MNDRTPSRTILAFILSLVFACCLRAAPIHDAAEAGDVAKVRALIGADPTLVDAKTNRDVTPLMVAALNGQLEVVKLLLEKGAALEAMSNSGEMPLAYAAGSGRLDVVKLLLEKGAAIEGRNGAGQPLASAAQWGRLDVVKLLLGKGAAVDAKDGFLGYTPLFWAAESGQLEVVKLLLENGAAVDAKSEQGWRPLMVALRSSALDVVKLLLENGAAVDAKDDPVGTPLMLAVNTRSLAAVKLLLEKGASPNVEVQGMTPLLLAERKGLTEIAELLRKTDATKSKATFAEIRRKITMRVTGPMGIYPGTLAFDDSGVTYKIDDKPDTQYPPYSVAYSNCHFLDNRPNSPEGGVLGLGPWLWILVGERELSVDREYLSEFLAAREAFGQSCRATPPKSWQQRKK